MDIDLQLLGDRIAALTPQEARELARYLEETDGQQTAGVLVRVGPSPNDLVAMATLHADAVARHFAEKALIARF
jgi:hypothetical protein